MRGVNSTHQKLIGVMSQAKTVGTKVMNETKTIGEKNHSIKSWSQNPLISSQGTMKAMKNKTMKVNYGVKRLIFKSV
ncbi:unnamed protein product [Arabis nemorensis]|uniref:Uncharacterized protein n=1 Tax=Arabis nemorensis TaxID=586526 RepID=A0A565AWZ8_9BRAS|nr:unnamed protein product [Arabis nemorensis]